MSNLRFNHVFTALMLLSLFSAFVIPPKFVTPGRAELQGIFSPISKPVRAVAGMIYRRVNPTVQVDDGSPAHVRAPETILQENRQLRLTLANLEVKFEQLSQLNADRQLVGGNIRPLCAPATVTGSDSSGLRESLLLSAPMLSGFKDGMPVLFAGGLVGRIIGAGFGAAQVQLITDPHSLVLCRVGQYKTDADGRITLECIEHLNPRVQGVGRDAMAIRGDITMQQVKDLNIGVNDVVLLDDKDWPANLQGYWVGKITDIHPQRNAPLFADIRVAPVSDLMRLREVMVMVKN